MDYSEMSLADIAQAIYKDWGSKVNFAAKPYLEAMATLQSVKDMYYCDTGKSIVAYFLCNATSWRGEVAREVKKELNKRIK
jgi:hypothetical protein|tara:strand:+ start:357 stop:599 length:243 start_codon:yes stop_codon:yes gene_type:complete